MNIHPKDMHQMIANAKFVISEGATIASEAGILGVNYFYINPLKVGYINYQINQFEHANSCSLNELLDLVKNDKLILQEGDLEKIESKCIDPTLFLVNYVLNYPQKH